MFNSLQFPDTTLSSPGVSWSPWALGWETRGTDLSGWGLGGCRSHELLLWLPMTATPTVTTFDRNSIHSLSFIFIIYFLLRGRDLSVEERTAKVSQLDSV